MDYKEKAADIQIKFGGYSILFVTEMISELKEINEEIGTQTGNDINDAVSFWEKVKEEIEKSNPKEEISHHQKSLSIEDLMNLSNESGYEYLKYIKPKLIEIVKQKSK